MREVALGNSWNMELPPIYNLCGDSIPYKCHNETSPRRPSVLDDASLCKGICISTWQTGVGCGCCFPKISISKVPSPHPQVKRVEART